MKNYCLLILMALLMAGKMAGQGTFTNIPNELTPNGMFDTVFSNLGHKYALKDLHLQAAKPLGGNYSINSIPTISCSAGYFTLFYTGSLFTTGTQSLQAQNVLCDLFSSMSNFISSPAAPGAIKILIEDPSSALLGEGESFCYTAIGPTNFAQGPIDGMVYQMLKSGVDPYSTLPISTFFTPFPALNFYHGAMRFSPSYTWHTNQATASIPADAYDLRTVALHELTHMLGFYSMIRCDGGSKLLLQQYSRYDQFLQDYNNNPLLSPISFSTCNFSQTFNTALTPTLVLSQAACPTGTIPFQNVTNCSLGAKYVSANVTSTVYTPPIFEEASSLSHFEDMCSYGSFTSACTPTPNFPYNDLYYVMANGGNLGSCYVKRYLKEEEKNVLCDLGYTTASVITSTAAGASHTYAAVCAPTQTLVGVNDGYNVSSGYTLTTNTATATIPLSTILSNDLPAVGLTVSCVEAIYGNATVSISGGSLVVNATVGSGVIVLKYYPQKGANEYGNATYIFVNFLPANCLLQPTCNMIQNSDFESLAAGNLCGTMQGSNAPILCGWQKYLNYVYALTSGCNANGSNTNLGINTLGLQPPINSFNGSSRVVLLENYMGLASGIQNTLNSPLINGNTYQISFWAKNPTGVVGTNSYNVNSDAAVVTIASHTISNFTPTLNFPTGLHVLTQFTVNANIPWTQFTNTFVYNPPSAQPGQVLIIGMQGNSLSQLFTSTLCALDMVNLVPIPTTTFVIPTPSVCGIQTFTNLANFTSTVAAFNFSGTGVTFTNNVYSFNDPPTLPGGIYPIAFNYTTSSGCKNTLWQSVQSSTAISLNASGFPFYCTNAGVAATLGIMPTSPTSSLNILWQPGGFTSASLAVTPTVTTVYTITATGANALNSLCSSTQTLLVDVTSNCCGTLLATNFNLTSITTDTYCFGNTLIQNSFTVQPNVDLILYTGKYIFMPGVKVTVAGGNPGGYLEIFGAHLYSCGDDMWDGIQVLDGGRLYAHNDIGADNMIEDAKIAIDASNQFTTTANPVLTVVGTVFNRNHVSIKLNNYQRSAASYSTAFGIYGNVFTCRNFSMYAPYEWPQTSVSALLSAPAGTIWTFSPYSMSAKPVGTLKIPYAGKTSSVAILVSSVSIPNSLTYNGIVIGNATAPDYLNLFDYHQTFIHATNSNLILENNVFQNTLRNPQPVLPFIAMPGNGAAVYSEATTMNNVLHMSAPSYDVGNRFWNCHYGVQGKNLYYFNIDRAVFRSVQTSTNTAIEPGHTGILMQTNRIAHLILRGEFTNIKNAINISLAPGATTLIPTTNFGIYATHLAIENNTFNGGNSAINVASLVQNTLTVAQASILPSPIGLYIAHNHINESNRGVSTSGLVGWRNRIYNNTIKLGDDPTATPQYGIKVVNGIATTTNQSYTSITGNDLRSIASNSLSDGQLSLVYCGNNVGPLGMGLSSPSVACNNLRNAYNGFEFNGSNIGTGWYGNKMENLARGMLLNYNGVIGTQGSTTFGIGNDWNGTWTGTNYNIFTEQSSASASPLNVNSVLSNLWGNPNPLSYFTFPPNVISSGSSYNCYAPTAITVSVTLPNSLHYIGDEAYYRAINAMYRFLHLNDSVKNTSTTLKNFYNAQSGSNLEKFMLTEQALTVGDFSRASGLLSGISPTNAVESNYLDYYNLYKSYAGDDFNHTNASDSSDLYNLSGLCPGISGSCIYQARALYNMVYHTDNVWEGCSMGAARIANFSVGNSSQHQIKIYPNPTDKRLIIETSVENESLDIEIRDLTQRIVFLKNIKLDGFIANLDLNLINGVYLITIIKSDHERHTQKIIISK